MTVSTNLGGWVNRRGLFAREPRADIFKRGSASPRPQPGSSRPEGQHIELGIAENNLFLLLCGAGPVAFALRRAADPGRHALRPLHQPRPRCAELRLLPGRPLHAGGHALRADPGAGGRRASVDRHAADRHGPGRPRCLRARLRRRACGRSCAGPSTTCSATAGGDPDERTWLRDETGGSVYLRLSTRPLEQPQRTMTPNSRRTSSTAPIGCAGRAPTPSSWSPITGAVAAGGDRGRRPDRRGPARRRPACRSPRPTGSMPAGRRPSGPASVVARSALSHIERLLGAALAAIAASSPSSTAIRRRWPGLAASTATASGARASSISARPARSRTSTAHHGIDRNAIAACGPSGQRRAPGPPPARAGLSGPFSISLLLSRPRSRRVEARHCDRPSTRRLRRLLRVRNVGGLPKCWTLTSRRRDAKLPANRKRPCRTTSLRPRMLRDAAPT